MIYSLLLLIAPFSLFSATLALPSSVDPSPGENDQLSCQPETVTKTVWLSAEKSSSSSTEAPTLAAATVSQEPLPSAPASLGTSLDVTAPFSNTTAKSASGYRSALYFTNWSVSYATLAVAD
jgi:hypothetical protein